MKTLCKLLPLLLAGALCLPILSACGKETPPAATSAGSTELTTEAQTPPDEPATYPLDGKTFVFLGSSVTYGSAANGYSMCDAIAENHDCTVVKWAVSGTTLVDNGSTSYVQRLINEAKRQKKCDHFICQLSTNDATQNKPLGEISDSFEIEDFDTTTIIGAMEYIIAFAKDKWDCPVSFYTGTHYDSAAYQKMVDALLELQEKWNIGVIDLWNDEEMNAVSARQYSRYMSDSIHPTKLGYTEWWTPKFEAHLSLYE